MADAKYQRCGDAELLALVPRDPESFGAFYDRHERALLAFLRRATGSAEVAADVAAETFAVLLEHALAGRAIEHPRGYLFGVARNKVAEGLRRGAVEQRARDALGLEILEVTDEVVARIDALGGDGGAALAALAELPDEQRQAVEARVLGEHSYDEIAAGLGCSNAVVRKRVSRGLATLRTQLADPAGGEELR